MKPAISVIMPIYNTPERYLRECLESIMLQDTNNFELICVNDCSSEEYVSEVLYDYLKREFCTVKIIELNEQSGAAIARNVGLKNAIGEYVIFLDSDDYYHSNFLSELYTNAKANESEVSFCGHNVCNKDLDIINDYIPDINKINKEKEDYLFSFRWSPWTKLVRRKFLLNEEISFQSLSSCNDVYYSVMTMLCASNISIIEKKLVDHRTGYVGQISSNRDPMNIWYAFNKLKKDIVEKPNYISLYEKMLDGMLVVASISEIKRAKDEIKCKRLYSTVRNYFCERVNDFSSDRFKCFFQYITENNYEKRWFDHNVFYMWKLNNNKSYIMKCIAGKNIVLWGLGERGDAFLEWAKHNCIEVNFLYDKEFQKTDRFKDKYHIVTEKDITKISNCIIIVSNYSIQNYIDENIKNSETLCIEKWCKYE